MCAELYAHFHHELQEASYYPQDSDHISDYRLFGMFHSSTYQQHNKDVILQSLQVLDGVVCVVFATIALGMGINLQDINQHSNSLNSGRLLPRERQSRHEW